MWSSLMQGGKFQVNREAVNLIVFGDLTGIKERQQFEFGARWGNLLRLSPTYALHRVSVVVVCPKIHPCPPSPRGHAHWSFSLSL